MSYDDGAPLRIKLHQLVGGSVRFLGAIGAPIDPAAVVKRAFWIHGAATAGLPRRERDELQAELELLVRALVGKELDA